MIVEEATRAQFGDAFRVYRALRMRRNELEYPAFADDTVDSEEARAAVADSWQLIEAAAKLLPHLGLF